MHIRYRYVNVLYMLRIWTHVMFKHNLVLCARCDWNTGLVRATDESIMQKKKRFVLHTSSSSYELQRAVLSITRRSCMIWHLNYEVASTTPISTIQDLIPAILLIALFQMLFEHQLQLPFPSDVMVLRAVINTQTVIMRSAAINADQVIGVGCHSRIWCSCRCIHGYTLASIFLLMQNVGLGQNINSQHTSKVNFGEL